MTTEEQPRRGRGRPRLRREDTKMAQRKQVSLEGEALVMLHKAQQYVSRRVGFPVTLSQTVKWLADQATKGNIR